MRVAGVELGQRIGSVGVLDDPSVVLTPIASVSGRQAFRVSNKPRKSSRRRRNAMLRLEMEAVGEDAAWIDTSPEAVDEVKKSSRPVPASLFLQPGEGRSDASAPTVLIEVGHG